ncbi:MAG: hypothetical protein J6X71_07430 [Bacteroidales bacterium]|nr:hypothetical protein [Bacteroidales bacterium]
MRKAAKDQTDSFMKKYLTPGEVEKGFGLYKMVAESRGTDQSKVATAIRRMPYVDYLHSRYWNLVALQVKHDAGCRCEKCGRRHGLVVHHPDYRWLGYDMYHIDSLQCLCRDCHEQLHGLKGKQRASKSKVCSSKNNKRSNTRVTS